MNMEIEFRKAVLRRRREGATMDEIADEIPTSRSSLYRMFQGRACRNRATQEAVIRFVEVTGGRGDNTPDRTT